MEQMHRKPHPAKSACVEKWDQVNRIQNFFLFFLLSFFKKKQYKKGYPCQHLPFGLKVLITSYFVLVEGNLDVSQGGLSLSGFFFLVLFFFYLYILKPYLLETYVLYVKFHFWLSCSLIMFLTTIRGTAADQPGKANDPKKLEAVRTMPLPATGVKISHLREKMEEEWKTTWLQKIPHFFQPSLEDQNGKGRQEKRRTRRMDRKPMSARGWRNVQPRGLESCLKFHHPRLHRHYTTQLWAGGRPSGNDWTRSCWICCTEHPARTVRDWEQRRGVGQQINEG